MSTRDEILAALTDKPEGLTSKELAPRCPSAECDPLIVGGLIAQLRSEDVIHAAEEKRDGGTVWIFGPAPMEEQLAHAARAIAAMRESPSTGRQAPDRAPKPATTPSPARPVEQPQPKEYDMEARERVLKAVEKAGEAGLQGGVVKEICGSAYAAKKLIKSLVDDGVIKITGKHRGTRYFLPKSVVAPSAPAPRQTNGNGHGNPYAAVLTDLKEKRAELAEQLAKVDKAIEAVGALA